MKGDGKDLSLVVEKEWEKRLRAFVRLERCRSLREMIIYFLEVMLAVARQKPNLQLTLEDSVELLKGHLRSLIPGELYQSLVEKAGEYGIKVSDLIRIFLAMALNFHVTLVPKNVVLRKEDFIELIIRQIQIEE